MHLNINGENRDRDSCVCIITILLFYFFGIFWYFILSTHNRIYTRFIILEDLEVFGNCAFVNLNIHIFQFLLKAKNFYHHF